MIGILKWFKNNKPKTDLPEITSEYTLSVELEKLNQWSLIIGVFPSEKAKQVSTQYKEFLELSNKYSEYDFYISVGKELVYKYFNLTWNTVHFIIHWKPELLLPDENLIEKWSPKYSLT